MSNEAVWTLTLEQAVRFAQEGWHYPLEDDEETRTVIRLWLEQHATKGTRA